MPRNYWEPKGSRGSRPGAEVVETIRQALADWEAATPEARETALAKASAAADRAEAKLLGLQAFVITFRASPPGKGRAWVRYYAGLGYAEQDAVALVERETFGQGRVISVEER